MKSIITLIFFLLLAAGIVQAQINIICTNPIAEQIMLGNYNPQTYMPAVVVNHPASIAPGIMNDVSTDSLTAYLIKLSSFRNRNTGSDTIADTSGIGAARRWAYSKFSQFSAFSQNRLIPSYLQFDQTICSVTQHRNVFAVLPAIDTTEKSVIIIEAHLDSRCENVCDTLCLAEGIEDNGSGSALVLELARVMSRFAYNSSIVFLLTIGEEQGLYGANAFAQYVQNNGINVKAVQNNDIIGGIICGQTSSPPGCGMPKESDSTHVRIFSFGNYTSPHKAFARFCKLQYLEEAQQFSTVPMTINIMVPEDRTGRGGDHIPFRQRGKTSVRFSSMNEHGNADVTNPNYVDRQHTERDILGVDTDLDGVIDSFFVDFNYMKRNTQINGIATAMAAIGPKMPDFTLLNDTNGILLTVTAQTQYNSYRVSVRRNANDYDLDLLYTFPNSLVFNIPNIYKDSTYYISLASMDTNGIESLFTIEKRVTALGNGPASALSSDAFSTDLELLNAVPNPFSQNTMIGILVKRPVAYSGCHLEVTDIKGRLVKKIPLSLNAGVNEVLYKHEEGPGMYNYSLVVNSKVISTRRLVISR